ncbi:hypothetical protein ABQE70_06465 [Xanthomonas campestris pv. campestris]|uniref:hypothetical protein n=1 Tax=Xanthomonas campestris TaxID=339 RepID=UPI0032E45C32
MRAGLSFMLHVATDARSNAVHGAGDDAERFTMQRRHGRWPFNWGAWCDSKHRRICLHRGCARLLVARCAREARHPVKHLFAIAELKLQANALGVRKLDLGAFTPTCTLHRI